MRLTAAVLALVLGVSQASAGFLDGNKLYELCDGNFGSTWFVMGVLDADASAVLGFDRETGKAFDLQKSICLPPDVIAGQAKDVVCKYLEDHPENRHYSAANIVLTAAYFAWPCQ
jgi:hypothetical protein